MTFEFNDVAENHFLQQVANGDVAAMNKLGHYYKNVKRDYTKAILYYMMAIEGGNVDAMNGLGLLHQHIGKNYVLAKKYLLMAIDHGDVDAMFNLGLYYEHTEKNKEKMIEYYEMAIVEKDLPNDVLPKKGKIFALCNLGAYYEKENDNKKAKKYYQLAFENVKKYEDMKKIRKLTFDESNNFDSERMYTLLLTKLS